MNIRTTICIVHHNTPDWLEASLRRIGKHTDPGTAVLVVENGSNAEIRDTAKSVCKSHGAEILVLPKVVSHGAALDAAAARVSTPWMLSMDSDAFPIRDGWLRDMHADADERTALVGPPAAICHSENPFGNYVHPSLCLVNMGFLRCSDARFRDAWPRWDTGEQLTIEAMRLGQGVRYLSTTGFNTYGNGVIIGESVFHAYYGTRLRVSSAQELLDADGVDAKTLRADHARLLEAEKEFAASGQDPFGNRADKSPKPDISVIVPFRRRDDMASRSLEAVLRSLDMQTMERQRYEIIVVEASEAPTVSENTGYRTIFAHCPGPHFRKSWAMNVGFRHATGDVLVFHDADILATETMLESIASRIGKSTPVVKPSFTVRDMNKRCTEDLHKLGDRKNMPLEEKLRAAPGGSVAVTRDAFLKVHGYNEGFVGWGGEDDEFLIRLRACGWNPPDLGCELRHLWHTHALRDPGQVRANRRLLDHVRRLGRRAVRKYIASMNGDFGNVRAHRKRGAAKKSTKTRILLAGAYSKKSPDANAGDDVTRDVLLRLLKRKGCSVRISPKHPCNESSMFDVDGVVVGGGGLISDHNEDAFYNYMSYIKHAAARGIPVSFIGIGVTRLDRKRRRISSLLRGATAVCLRDALSQGYLDNGDFAAVSADLGWLLEERSSPGQLASADKTAGVFVVGNSYADSERYRSSVHKCVDSLVGEGLKPTLVMHARDDKRAVPGFLKRYPNAEILDYFASEKNTPIALVRALSKMSKVVTSRYHGIVFSVLACTPAEVIPGSPDKVLFLRDEIGAERLADKSELPAVLREMRRRSRGNMRAIDETVAKASRPPAADASEEPKVSVCMITQNDATYMRRALAGIPRISQVGEILAVDGGSEDDTVSILEKDGRARILRRPFPHDFSDQKNFCISQARNEWIVWIDSDEVIPKEFWESISELVASGRDAFQFPRENFIGVGPNPNNDIKSDPDYQFRFFSRKCRWVGRVHENLTGYEGEAGKADFVICHRKSRDRQDWNNRYYAWIHGSSESRPSGQARVEAEGKNAG